MPVLPFHNYIGPGNDINNGPCVDADDCIAKQHDIKYENARTAQDVRRADEEAIHEFRRNWQNGNWHSLIGDVGLSLKYCVETYTGIIYPKLDAYQCEILPLFHNLLVLHCVNKNKNNFVAQFSRTWKDNKLELDNTKLSDLPTRNFFFVLILWYRLFQKYQDSPEMTNLVANRPMNDRACVNGLLVKNYHLLEKYDIFHLKAWMRFFSLQYNEPVSTENYNEEEFTNLFLQYD